MRTNVLTGFLMVFALASCASSPNIPPPKPRPMQPEIPPHLKTVRNAVFLLDFSNTWLESSQKPIKSSSSATKP